MAGAVALFSGGLDSILSIRILQRQGFEVDALNIRTVFDCCQTPASQIAHELGVRLTVLSVADDYVDSIRKPSYGYGRGMNPCVDCRIYMSRMAKTFMEQIGACVVITGEIVGQRPMSQKKRDLAAIAEQSGLAGRLLRPLSARLLEPTIPELAGLIDREKLYGFSGRGRGGLIDLAREFGINDIPQPSTGCALTEVSFAPRVLDLLEYAPNADRWHFDLLKTGRHFRVDDDTKLVVGRNAEENGLLRMLFQKRGARSLALLHPESFLGPDVLVVGRPSERSIALAGALMFRYTRGLDADDARVRLTDSDGSRVIRVEPDAEAYKLDTL